MIKLITLTRTLTILILALTCATLHAQSVIVKGTGAGAVRGVIGQTPISVLTNLSVTGALDPDVTGMNYVQIADYSAGYPAWSNSVNGFTITPEGDPGLWYYYIVKGAAKWKLDNAYRAQGNPTGTYSVVSGCTGTPTVVYWYQTNYSSAVTVRGKATP